MALVQLRPGRADDQQRHALRPVGQVLEEGEQRGVGPVQILEDEHRRPVGREPLEEAPPGGEGLLARRPAPPAMPTSGARRACSQSRSGSSSGNACSIFAAACSGESDSRMPASALTISPSAQNAIPSP